jgi:ribosomal protein S14
MTEDERAAAFLRRHSGVFLCAACIASELHVPADLGRTLMWKLQALPGYEMRGARCVNCSRGKRVIRHVGTAELIGTTAEVVALFLANKGITLCDACVAFAVEKSLSDVIAAVASVEGLEEFERQQGTCSVCGRAKVVTAALEVSTYDPQATTERHEPPLKASGARTVGIRASLPEVG